MISLFPHLHTPFSPSLISLTVPVDVKHHAYLLTFTWFIVRGPDERSGGERTRRGGMKDKNRDALLHSTNRNTSYLLGGGGGGGGGLVFFLHLYIYM